MDDLENIGLFYYIITMSSILGLSMILVFSALSLIQAQSIYGGVNGYGGYGYGYGGYGYGEDETVEEEDITNDTIIEEVKIQDDGVDYGFLGMYRSLTEIEGNISQVVRKMRSKKLSESEYKRIMDILLRAKKEMESEIKIGEEQLERLEKLNMKYNKSVI